ncbi:MAG: hypothetical protein IPN17_35590 [Deltaproteobacteria bacterium]|nr:hypothetical protein [Deltaproteobacteria bacterium]
MPRPPHRCRAGLRRGLGVVAAALVGSVACVPRPYSVDESMRRAEQFLTPVAFAAAGAYDEDGRAFPWGAVAFATASASR